MTTVVAPGFEPVAEEFERNLAERGELGAAFAVYRDGEPVLDLWGGVADRRPLAPGSGTRSGSSSPAARGSSPPAC